MSWPATAVVTDDPVTATQLNGLPVMIANTTLSDLAASISFSSIPSHYAHLRVVAYLRSNTVATSTSTLLRFNADSGANYDVQYLQGLGAATAAAEGFAATSASVGPIPANTAGANLFGVHSMVIPHYANAINNKALVNSTGYKFGTAASNMSASIFAAFWRSNAAITQVTITPGAGNLVSGSRATLWGWP